MGRRWPALLAFLGILLLAATAVISFKAGTDRAAELLATGTPGTALVVDEQMRPSKDGEKHFHYRLRVEDRAGRVYDADLYADGVRSDYSRGARIPILYRVGDPTDLRTREAANYPTWAILVPLVAALAAVALSIGFLAAGNFAESDRRRVPVEPCDDA
ncbi:hypothetical protein D5S17_32255 [Pseudonocardiaceae bacterium YIM PH 21723]|nr:hypothetical protein D5S17_32255 [Pseudonocardiaceae bacterium YIM PH 21723]